MRDPSIACFLDSTVDFRGEQQVLRKPPLVKVSHFLPSYETSSRPIDRMRRKRRNGTLLRVIQDDSSTKVAGGKAWHNLFVFIFLVSANGRRKAHVSFLRSVLGCIVAGLRGPGCPFRSARSNHCWL
jgi:hypothetical protein